MTQWHPGCAASLRAWYPALCPRSPEGASPRRRARAPRSGGAQPFVPPSAARLHLLYAFWDVTLIVMDALFVLTQGGR